MGRGSSIEGRIDELYGLDPARFVSARGALERELKEAGDRDGAARVRGLERPTVTAAIVNLLYRRNRAEFDRLLRAGKKLRDAQVSGRVDPETLRRAIDRRREALSGLATRGERIFAELGRSAGRAQLRRVETTLDALATQGWGETPPGRLTRDLEPAGFDALLAAGTVASVRGAPKRRGREAEAARERAEREAARRRTEVEQAASAVAAAEQELERAAAEERRSRERLAQSRARLAEIRAELRRLRARARRASAALARARRAVDAAGRGRSARR